MTLTEYADRVLLFHRRDRLRAQQALQERLLGHPKVTIHWNTQVTEVLGEDSVSGVRLRDETGQESQVELNSLFIYVGLEPNSELVQGLVETDQAGHIPVNLSMATAEPGLFAVGDVRHQSSSQLVAAAGDGATAAIAAYQYLRGRR